MPAPSQETGTHRSHQADTADRTPSGSTTPMRPLPRLAPCTRTPAQQEALDQLARRREAANRSVPLDCGRCRDPWTCRCNHPEPSDRMLDAGREAALHLLDAGYLPLLDANTMRGLWRRRGDDRRLAQHIHQLTQGARSA